MVKVLHININYIATTLHQNMTNKLQEMGIDNRVFVPTYDKNIGVISVNDNVVVEECFKKWDRISFFYKQAKIEKALLRCINVSDYDIVHAYTLFSDGNIAYNLKREYKIPYVVAVRGTDVREFFGMRKYLRRRGIKIMEEAENVFFLSPAYKQKVITKYVPKRLREVIEKKSVVIPNGIDDMWFDNQPDCKSEENVETIKVAYAGQVSQNKNVGTTLEALKLLEGKGYSVSFSVAGAVVDERLFETMQKVKFVTYHGKKTKEELINFYRANDVFVMPSHTETFGLVYAEAMSQGLPVVYTRGQGFDGQFPDGTVGYAVSDKNPDEIAERIIDCMRNRGSMSKRCIELSKRFKWSDICEKYLEIYKDIVS